MTSHYLRKIRALLAAQLEQIDDIMRKEDAHPPRCVYCHRVIKDGEDIVPAFEPQWGAAHAVCVPHVPIQPTDTVRPAYVGSPIRERARVDARWFARRRAHHLSEQAINDWFTEAAIVIRELLAEIARVEPKMTGAQPTCCVCHNTLHLYDVVERTCINEVRHANCHPPKRAPLEPIQPEPEWHEPMTGVQFHAKVSGAVDPRPSLNDVLDRLGALLNDSRSLEHLGWREVIGGWHTDLRAALQRQDEYTTAVRQSERQYYESRIQDVTDELDRFLRGGDRPAERDLPLHDRVLRWRRLLTEIVVRTI